MRFVAFLLVFLLGGVGGVGGAILFGGGGSRVDPVLSVDPTQTSAAGRVEAPRATVAKQASEFSEPAVERQVERDESATASDSELVTSLKERIAALEREAQRLRDAAEPRLGSDRVRARSKLLEAVREQGLPNQDLFQDIADYVSAPHLVQEDPLGYLALLERVVLATNAHRAARADEGESERTLPFGPKDGAITVARYRPTEEKFRDSFRIEWELPGSLPLGHVSHLSYEAYGAFDESGVLTSLSLGRQQGVEFDLLRFNGELRMDRAPGAGRRSPVEAERLVVALDLAAKRIADLLLE